MWYNAPHSNTSFKIHLKILNWLKLFIVATTKIHVHIYLDANHARDYKYNSIILNSPSNSSDWHSGFQTALPLPIPCYYIESSSRWWIRGGSWGEQEGTSWSTGKTKKKLLNTQIPGPWECRQADWIMTKCFSDKREFP